MNIGEEEYTKVCIRTNIRRAIKCSHNASIERQKKSVYTEDEKRRNENEGKHKESYCKVRRSEYGAAQIEAEQKDRCGHTGKA